MFKLILIFLSFEENWVSLFNPTNAVIDISGYIISDRLGLGRREKKTPVNEFTFPAGSKIQPNAYFKQVLPKNFLSRDHNPVLFKYNKTQGIFTGDYLEFVVDDNEISFDK